MQTIWFPAPVFVLFRRLVNVVSTLSISQHYLHQPAATNSKREADDHSCAWRTLKSWGWLSWANRELAGSRFSLANVEGDRSSPSSFQPTPQRQSQRQTRPRPLRSKEPHDTIHRLMSNPALYDPVRPPRQPIVLCHGKQRLPFRTTWL
jgi:triacylglycerol lipase